MVTAEDWVLSSVAVDGDLLVVGSYDNKVYFVNTTSHALLAYFETNDDVYSSPAIANGQVYIGSRDNHIYCFGGELCA